MSREIAASDELARLEQRKADEAVFLEAWRKLASRPDPRRGGGESRLAARERRADLRRRSATRARGRARINRSAAKGQKAMAHAILFQKATRLKRKGSGSMSGKPDNTSVGALEESRQPSPCRP
jgi:hypothetical protein